MVTNNSIIDSVAQCVNDSTIINGVSPETAIIGNCSVVNKGAGGESIVVDNRAIVIYQRTRFNRQ